MKKAKFSIDDRGLETSSEILRALAHPLRISILQFIDQFETINVNKIYNTLKLEQSITSQHLKILRNADIVQTTRDGKFIHYKLNYKKIETVMNAVNKFVNA